MQTKTIRKKKPKKTNILSFDAFLIFYKTFRDIVYYYDILYKAIFSCKTYEIYRKKALLLCEDMIRYKIKHLELNNEFIEIMHKKVENADFIELKDYLIKSNRI